MYSNGVGAKDVVGACTNSRAYGGAQYQTYKGRMASEANGAVFLPCSSCLRHQGAARIIVWESKAGTVVTRGSDVWPNLRGRPLQ